MYGFDISEFWGKVVSMTVRSTHITHFLVDFRPIWEELSGGTPAGMTRWAPPPWSGVGETSLKANFKGNLLLTGPKIGNSAGSLGSKPCVFQLPAQMQP